MELKIKALSPKIGTEIPAPFYATPGSAAMDLHACIDEAVVIPAGKRVVIPTGLAIALPDAGYVALVYARSGLGIKHGIAPANCVGVIDILEMLPIPAPAVTMNTRKGVYVSYAVTPAAS